VFDGPAPSSHPVIQKFRADSTLGDVCQYLWANVAEIRQLAEKFASDEKKTGQTTTETVSSSMIFVSVSAASEHF
jgi:hypothetical protein